MKSIFILLVAFWLVRGQNCPENSASNDCAFKCIQMVYEKKYCRNCTDDVKINDETQKNEILAWLVQRDLIHFNGENATSMSCEDCSSSQAENDFIENFGRPSNLKKLFDCTLKLFSTSDETNKSLCSEIDNEELFDYLIPKYTNETWCIDALNKTFFNKNTNESPKNESTGNGAIAQQTSSAEKPISSTEKATSSTEKPTEKVSVSNLTVEPNQTTEVSSTPGANLMTEPNTTIQPTSSTAKTETVPPPTNEPTKKSNDLDSDESVEESAPPSTTVSNEPVSTSTVASDSTVKSAPKLAKKTGKKAEEHHYIGSVTIIGIIVVVLLSILIISAVVLSVFVNRRKRAQNRTTSTTYVFEARN